MKKALAIFVLLAAGMAMGQSYKLTAPPVQATQDIRTMTATVNAWKYFPGSPVCYPKTFELGKLDNSFSCMGGNGGPPYKYDPTTKTWIGHPEMGDSNSIKQLVIVNWGGSSIAANIYSLQSTSYCTNLMGNAGGTTAWYDLFKWNPSNNTWTQPHAGSCMLMASADYKGNLYVVGWNGNNHITALFQSTNGGQSYSLWSDSWKFINMTDNQEGCAIANAGSIWEIFTSGAPSSFPAIPSGTAAGCTVAESPFVMMAWNTAGQAYIITEGNTAWQAVTGINLQRAEGFLGYYIFGEDSSGKPYHWNTNAPGVAATYGGQWTQSQGCPTPGTPCNNPATHTLHHALYFTTCHGINGCAESQSTQLWSANFSLPHSDYNPQCDPYFGGGVDEPECHVTESAYGHCNQSGAQISCLNASDPQCKEDYVLGSSIDVTVFQLNNGSIGPDRHQTVMYQGYYAATVQNTVIDGCYVSDPVPTCPALLPYANVKLKRTWEGNLNAEAQAYSRILNDMAESRFGGDSPYVYRSTYFGKLNPDGSFTDVSCYPVVNDSPSYVLHGNYDEQPHCY